MRRTPQEVLQLLRYELNFIEQGGYQRLGEQASPFRDSLSCLNFGDPVGPHACHECILYDFVPERARTEDVPCHFIPLDDNGSTIAALLQQHDHTAQLETILKIWLERAIAQIESD